MASAGGRATYSCSRSVCPAVHAVLLRTTSGLHQQAAAQLGHVCACRHLMCQALRLVAGVGNAVHCIGGII